MKVVVPLDGSPFAETAIPVSLSLARALGARIELVSIYLEEPLIAEWQIPGEELRASYEAYQQSVLQRLPSAADLDVVTTVLSGPVAETLETHVADGPDAIVIMSTHGRGPLSRAWLGSVADRLVRHARVPVLLLRPEDETPDGFETSYTFGSVVVALDGSERAEYGLVWAKHIAEATGAAIALVRAVPSRFVTSPYLPHTVRETQELLEQDEATARTYLTTLQDRLGATGMTVQTEILPGVQPGTGITRYADRTRASLVVVTTHGRGGLPRLVLGSVADKVIRGATTPVLIVRAPSSHSAGDALAEGDPS
jgi:nucleotide-binding universal stress UspA family protein